jgi:hypothetical protein
MVNPEEPSAEPMDDEIAKSLYAECFKYKDHLNYAEYLQHIKQPTEPLALPVSKMLEFLEKDRSVQKRVIQNYVTLDSHYDPMMHYTTYRAEGPDGKLYGISVDKVSLHLAYSHNSPEAVKKRIMQTMVKETDWGYVIDRLTTAGNPWAPNLFGPFADSLITVDEFYEWVQSKLAKAVGKPYFTPIAPPPKQQGSVMDTLAEVVPGLKDNTLHHCPAQDCDVRSIVTRAVIHLNDKHEWSREAIADWLETLDVDLSFVVAESPTEGVD